MLHDHGDDVEWSLVLFLRTGEEEAARGGPTASGGEKGRSEAAQGPGSQGRSGVKRNAASAPDGPDPAPGSLLLKMQVDPDEASKFSYFSIAPTPGELWAFPGYVQHAVLPRQIGAARPATNTNTNTNTPSSQRISCAMNLYKPFIHRRSRPPFETHTGRHQGSDGGAGVLV